MQIIAKLRLYQAGLAFIYIGKQVNMSSKNNK